MTVRFIGDALWTGRCCYPHELTVINIEGDSRTLKSKLEEIHGDPSTVILASTLIPGFFKDSRDLSEDVIHLIRTGDSLIFGIPDGKTANDYDVLIRSVAASMGIGNVKVTDHSTSELISYLLTLRRSMDRAFSDLASSLSFDTGSSVDAVRDILGTLDRRTSGNSGIGRLMTDDAPELVKGIGRSDSEMRCRYIEGLMSDGTRNIGFHNMYEDVVRDMTRSVRKNGGKCYQIGTEYKGIKKLEDLSMIPETCDIVITSEEPEIKMFVRTIHWG